MTKSLKSGIIIDMTVINSIVFTLLLLTQDVDAYPRYSSDNVSDEPKLFFIMPSNGQVLTSPIKVKFGIKGSNTAYDHESKLRNNSYRRMF